MVAQHINTLLSPVSFRQSEVFVYSVPCQKSKAFFKTKGQVLGDNLKNKDQRLFFYLQVFKNPSCYLQASVNIFCFIFCYTKNVE